MADNIAAQTDATKQLAADEIGGVHYPRTKLVIGNDGVNDGDISANNPLPVAIGTWNGLTDAQLRGTPVQVTGTVGLDGAALAALENITVGGTVDLGATSLAALESITAVGPLTDGQLRATAVPVSLASVPLATDAATETTLAGLNAKMPSGLSVSAGRLVVDGSGVVQPVTVGNFPATQPVSAASLPLPAGAATEASLAALLAVAKTEDDPAVSGDKGFPLLAMRQLADTTSTDNDGDYTLIKIDEEGRVKVATKPASFTLVTGTITASGQTVFCDVSRASNVMIAMVATSLVGHNAAFEGSIDSTDGVNGSWFIIQAIRSNANAIETVTGVLAATPTYAWEASVNGLSFIRVRATAHTSGNAVWKFQRGSYATEPIPAAQISGTQPVSGTVTATVTPPAPTTPYFLNSAATTNGALIITGTSAVTTFYATNIGATPAFVKLYNKATAPTVGTDVPEMIIPVPAAVSGVPGVAAPNIGFIGHRFALGLGIAITGAMADTDTTAVAAGQVKVKLSRTT